MLADDIGLVNLIYGIDDCATLQSDLNNTVKYCKLNSLKLNSDKCERLRITLKKCDLPSYKIENANINIVNKHKHIGVIYDSKLNFNFHVDMIVQKALKKFYILRFLCKRVDGQTFLKLYMTYILPILEYTNLCLTYTKSQCDRIEKVQKRITKFICFKLKKCLLKYEERLKFLKLHSLKKRREIQILKIVFKIRTKSSKICENWLSEIEFYESKRNGILCRVPLKRIELVEKYLFNNAIKLFNDLPINVRNETKFCNYVKKLNDLL